MDFIIFHSEIGLICPLFFGRYRETIYLYNADFLTKFIFPGFLG